MQDGDGDQVWGDSRVGGWEEAHSAEEGARAMCGRGEDEKSARGVNRRQDQGREGRGNEGQHQSRNGGCGCEDIGRC